MATEILSTDYNRLQGIVSNILGVGHTDYGYGQQVSSAPVTTSAVISAAQWSNLRNDIIRIRAHQTNSVLSLTELPVISPTTLITETSIKNLTNSYSAWVTAIDNDRAIVSPDQSTRSTLLNTSVTASWNGKITNTITVEFKDDAGNPTADATRRFFNSGGTLEFSASRAGGTTHAKNAAWTSMLSDMLTIRFSLNTTSSTGIGTILNTDGQPIGFSYLYAHTDKPYAIFEQHGTNYGYALNVYRISVSLDSTKSMLTFTIDFDDADVSIPSGQGSEYNVDGTVVSTIKCVRATGSYVSIPVPTCDSTFPVGGAVPFKEVVTPPTASVTPTYTVTITGGNRIGGVLTIDEGVTSSDVVITVNTTNLFSPATSPVLLPWKIVGTGSNPVSTYDITPLTPTSLPLDGFISIIDGVGSFRIDAVADKLTESTESFYVEITKVDKSKITTETINIRDLSLTPDVLPTPKKVTGSYTLEQSAIAVQAGGHINFTVTVPSDFTGTKLYWKTAGGTGITGADFEKDPNANTQDGLIGFVNIDPTTLSGTFTRTTIVDMDPDETFSIKIFKLQTDTTPLLVSDPITILGVVKPSGTYSVEQSAIEMSANTEVTFTVHAPAGFTGDRLYWKTNTGVGISGTNFYIDQASDKYGYSSDGMIGYVMINSTSKSGILTRKVLTAASSDVQFNIGFYVSQSDANAVVSSMPVTIRGAVPGLYQFSQTATEIKAGDEVTINVTVPTSVISSGVTQLYWKTVQGQGINGADFVIATTGANVVPYGNSSDGLTGFVPIKSGTASLTRKTVSDLDPDETFAITFHETYAGPIVVTSSAIKIIGAVAASSGGYTVTSNWKTVAEGNPVQIKITTPTTITDGTNLHWKINGPAYITAGDFSFSGTTVNSSGLEGVVPVTNHIATFTITPTLDHLSELTEQFSISIFDSDNTLQVTSDPITILDASVNANYTITAVPTTIAETLTSQYSNIVTIKAKTVSVDPGTTLKVQYSGAIIGTNISYTSATGISDYTFDATTQIATFKTSSDFNNLLTMTYTTIPDFTTTGDKTFVWTLLDSNSGSLGSTQVTIKDTSLNSGYTLVVSPKSPNTVINETDKNVFVLTVTASNRNTITPPVVYLSQMTGTGYASGTFVKNVTTSNVDYSLTTGTLDATTGAFTVTADVTTFEFTVNADQITENTESLGFNLHSATPTTADNKIAFSNVASILDTSIGASTVAMTISSPDLSIDPAFNTTPTTKRINEGKSVTVQLNFRNIDIGSTCKIVFPLDTIRFITFSDFDATNLPFNPTTGEFKVTALSMTWNLTFLEDFKPSIPNGYQTFFFDIYSNNTSIGNSDSSGFKYVVYDTIPETGTHTFTFAEMAGSVIDWTIPKGINALQVELVGGSGGTGGPNSVDEANLGATGQAGKKVTGKVTGLTGGNKLRMIVGGGGSRGKSGGPTVSVSPGGSSGLVLYNGGEGGKSMASSSGFGGGGGAASVIYDLTNSKVLAAAGGGGGGGGAGYHSSAYPQISNYFYSTDTNGAVGQSYSAHQTGQIYFAGSRFKIDIMKGFAIYDQNQGTGSTTLNSTFNVPIEGRYTIYHAVDDAGWFSIDNGEHITLSPTGTMSSKTVTLTAGSHAITMFCDDNGKGATGVAIVIVPYTVTDYMNTANNIWNTLFMVNGCATPGSSPSNKGAGGGGGGGYPLGGGRGVVNADDYGAYSGSSGQSLLPAKNGAETVGNNAPAVGVRTTFDQTAAQDGKPGYVTISWGPTINENNGQD